MVSLVPVTHDMFREVFNRSITVPVLKHSHPLALCVRYGRWRAQVHKPVLPCRGRVLPHSSHPWRAFLICPMSSLFRDLAREPCLASHLCAPALLLMLRSPTKPSPTSETR